MNPIQAVKTLTSLGYRFELAGDRLRYRYEGQGEPEPNQVRPLLEAVKVNKPDVMDYLIKLAKPDHVPTCFDCERFRPALSPNPRQAWGHCEKRRRGRFGCATACEAVMEHKGRGHSGWLNKKGESKMKAAKLTWEEIYQDNTHGVEIVLRAKVPGGWLVRFANTGGANRVVIFVPDPDYGWVAEEVED